MLYNRQGDWRAAWRLALFFGLGTALSVSAIFVSSLFSQMTGGFDSTRGTYYLMLCLAWTLSALVLLHFVDGVEAISALGLSLHPRVGHELLMGSALGLLIVALVWGVEWALGWLVVLPSSDVSLFGLVTSFSLIFVAAFFEELFFRGYALQVLLQVLGRWPAILITSVLFGLAHNGNPSASWLSFVDTTMAGVLIALTYERTHSLWIPTLLHVCWNYAMGVLLGLEVSGLVMPSRWLESDMTPAGFENSLWTGGDYGPEAGLLLLVVSAPFVVYWTLRKASPIDVYRPIWARQLRRSRTDR